MGINRFILFRHGGEALFKIVDDIVDMLRADGEADGVLMDTCGVKLLLGKLRMGSGRGMDNQRLYVGHVREQREDLQSVDEAERLILAALYIKGEYGTAAVGEILLIQLMVGMVGKRGMIYPFDQRMIFKVFYDLLSVLRVALQPERKRFGSLQEQKCREGRDSRAGISEQDRADICRERCFAGGLGEFYAVIAGVRLRDPRISAGGSPVKASAVYNNSAEGRAVTADKLGGGMNDYVRAVLERTDKVGCAEGVVDNERQAVRVGDLCQSVDVGDVAVGIAEGLDVDRLCVGLNRRRDLLEIMDVDKSGVDAVKRKRVRQQVGRAAVDRLLSYYVLALLGKRLDGVCDGSR